VNEFGFDSTTAALLAVGIMLAAGAWGYCAGRLLTEKILNRLYKRSSV
jgi:hypothetical protein